MRNFSADNDGFVTLSVVRTRTGQIELVRQSNGDIVVYYDSPEDALRRWNAWTLALIVGQRVEHVDSAGKATSGAAQEATTR